MEIGHAAEMYLLLTDGALWQFTDGGMPESLSALTERYARLARRSSPTGDEHWLNWIARDLASGNAVGFVQASVSRGDSTARIAYVIGRRYWGLGFAGDSVRLMIDELENNHSVTRLVACVDCRNCGSTALLRRLGMQCVDELDPQNNQYLGEIVNEPQSIGQASWPSICRLGKDSSR